MLVTPLATALGLITTADKRFHFYDGNYNVSEENVP